MTEEKIKALAERYVQGASQSDIRAELAFTDVKFAQVVKVARSMYPDLDWLNRKPFPRAPSPTKEYVEMKDGDPRSRRMPQGSIVQGRHRST